MKTLKLIVINSLILFSFCFFACETLINILGTDGQDNIFIHANEYSVYSTVLNSLSKSDSITLQPVQEINGTGGKKSIPKPTP